MGFTDLNHCNLDLNLLNVQISIDYRMFQSSDCDWSIRSSNQLGGCIAFVNMSNEAHLSKG